MYDKVLLLYLSTIFPNSSCLYKLLYIIRLVEKPVKTRKMYSWAINSFNNKKWYKYLVNDIIK